MTEPDHSKHRDRLKRRFLDGDPAAQTDEAVLELLLFQHMPRRDVNPWVDKLLAEHGSLPAILAARGKWPERDASLLACFVHRPPSLPEAKASGYSNDKPYD